MHAYTYIYTYRKSEAHIRKVLHSRRMSSSHAYTHTSGVQARRQIYMDTYTHTYIHTYRKSEAHIRKAPHSRRMKLQLPFRSVRGQGLHKTTIETKIRYIHTCIHAEKKKQQVHVCVHACACIYLYLKQQLPFRSVKGQGPHKTTIETRIRIYACIT